MTGVVLTTPPPGLQEAAKKSTSTWQEHLGGLFHHTKDRYPDVVWEFVGDGATQAAEEVWGHKAIVYARAPPSFQSRYFAFKVDGAISQLHLAHSSSSHYLAESALSLPEPSFSRSVVVRTPSPSPFRASSPSNTLHSTAPATLLRLTTSIDPTLFSNELEYLYTGKGFSEAFEFLFDEPREQEEEGEDAEVLRTDKLRKDLVYMWRSRLYSDVHISLTGDFNSSHESTTAIFSSHRFILMSRSPYFRTTLLSSSKKSSDDDEPHAVNLPSPPFTPASIHFTLGFIYTGTLVFSHRSYDLSTAFAILRSATFLSLPTLHDEIQARIAQEMMHGLFHAFIPFVEYERLTGGKWGTSGCRCRQCARRAPRVLEFALADDVKNPVLERGARRALVGLFGEGWCTQEFASLSLKIRESILIGVGNRTRPVNVFGLLFAAEHALAKLENSGEIWVDVVRVMIVAARKVMDEVLAKEAEECFNSDEWLGLMESEQGVRSEDGKRVDWAMSALLRGVKENNAPILYQTLASSVLLRPHPTDVNLPHLPTNSALRVYIGQVRLDLLKFIGQRWLAIRKERGFDSLEAWAIKEISEHIERPLKDLLNAPTSSSSKSNVTKRVRASAVTIGVTTNARVNLLSGIVHKPVSTSASSVRSVATSSLSKPSTTSMSSLTPTPRQTVVGAVGVVSLEKGLANDIQAGEKIEVQERPDSKHSLSILGDGGESMNGEVGHEDDDPNDPIGGGKDVNECSSTDQRDVASQDDENDQDSASINSHNAKSELSKLGPTTPINKSKFATNPSSASINSKMGSSPSGSTPASRSKFTSVSIKSNSTLRTVSSVRTPASTSKITSRSSSRVSTASSRLNVSVTGNGSRTKLASRPISRLSTSSLASSGLAAPKSTIQSPRSPAANARMAAAAAAKSNQRISPAQERARRVSGGSVSSVATNASLRSVRSTVGSVVGQKARKVVPALPVVRGKTIPVTSRVAARADSIKATKSTPSTVTTRPGKTPIPLGGKYDETSTVASTSGGSISEHSASPASNFAKPSLTVAQPSIEGATTTSSDIDEESVILSSDGITAQLPSTSTTTARPSTLADILSNSLRNRDRRKTDSSASTSSVGTIKRKRSTDTIRANKPPQPVAPSSVSKVLPRTPPFSPSPLVILLPNSSSPDKTFSDYIPRGSTLDIGIPCIISSKRKKFKAYARYIGEVEGEAGPWVGIEVPMPLSDSWGDRDFEDTARPADDRQWNDGSWGGIRYFEISGMGGSEIDYGGEDRAARRRRIDGGSMGGSISWSKGILKREGDLLSISSDRRKRLRSVSPAMSDISCTESRGLFVRPQQVLYVVDAVGSGF